MQDIQKLISGFRRFQRQFFHSDDTLFDQLRRKQTPKVLVIGCSDSRVDPAIVTDCRPGDLFVIRNVANLVPPYEPDTRYHGVSSALEYAVRFLEVEHIIVLGHSHCGGIDALMRSNEQTPIGEFIDHWVDIARPAKHAVLKDLLRKAPDLQCRACEQAAMLISLENLLTFPWITDRVEQGKLAIHGWYFDLEAGEMLTYNPETGLFEKLVGNIR
ncbi:MAG: carbonic anhydrase [Anaerohalosphaeraceae bacterium]